jgi:hypothetical protein
VRRFIFASLAAAWVVACSGGPTRLGPLAVGTGGAPSDAGPSDAAEGGAAPSAARRIRTVEQRNPFGDTTIEDNLLVDGDFELSSSNGQYGWRAISLQPNAEGATDLVTETGGLCHSGMSCGVVDNQTALLAFGAEPRDKPMDINVWVKPPAADCAVVSVSLVSCTSEAALTVATIAPVTTSPGADGWCHLEAIAPTMDSQPCLFVSASLQKNQRALVDDASIVAADGTGSKPLEATVPSPALRRQIAFAVRWFAEHTIYGRAPRLPFGPSRLDRPDRRSMVSR